MDTNPETSSKKRKQRAILSCVICRKRKLKCDRELPCNRCINGAIAGQCAYGNDLHFGEDESTDTHELKRQRKDSNRPRYTSPTQVNQQQKTIPDRPGDPLHTSEESSQNAVKRLEQRVATLEILLDSLQSKDDDHAQPIVASEPAVEDNFTVSAGLFKGRNYRTFYYGPTNPMLVVAHFPDLQPFMKRIFINSTLARLRQDLKGLEDRARVSKTANRVISVTNLRSLLPERDTVDKVVKTYFETFETTYRILHIPTFWEIYRTYWDDVNPPTQDTGIDAIVLAILACTLCISTHDTTRYDINGSTFRAKAIVWIKACEAWLKRQSNKHRTLAVVQVRLLRLLALSTTCLKTKEYYQEVQGVVASMRAAGMHRDPSILGSRCSVFEGEIRRRLWATVMELEIQAAVDKGISSLLTNSEYDCNPPRNINDADLSPETKHLPPSQPPSTFTDTSYLHHSAHSLSLRTKLCAQANTLHPHPTSHSLPTTLASEKAIRLALTHLPTFPNPPALQASTLLDLQLRQFILILHTPRALDVRRRSDPEHRYSMLTLLETAAILIEKHAKLMETGNFSLCCIRSDYLRAALLICHITYHASKADDTLITPLSKQIFTTTIPPSFLLLEERSMRPGRGTHQYWFLSAACSLVSIQFEPATRTKALERQACDRVCKLLYRVLSLQDEVVEGSGVCEVVLGAGVGKHGGCVDGGSVGHEGGMGRMDAAAASSYALPHDAFMDTTSVQLPQLDPFHADMDSAWLLNDSWFMDDFPVVEGNEKFDFRFLDNVGGGHVG
ncbi:hypothetical protein CC80DRAFT_150507 [Byssothecium circinans]|uniref:Zn(2)-C6 fungal-type domain-containing protein n=1 Tax=Byssothecium circinans TaxID=147558 RepID=A0A6A5TL69_9PLEO|nr:hypothetical protein CC80DRAFT_150507 [Byssothecium circinans]